MIILSYCLVKEIVQVSLIGAQSKHTYWIELIRLLYFYKHTQYYCNTLSQAVLVIPVYFDHFVKVDMFKGFRMTLTPTLRKYDAATISLGAVRGITVPPKTKDFVTSGLCTSECSKKVS